MEMPLQPVGTDLALMLSTTLGIAVGLGLTVGAVLVAGGVLLEKVAAF